MGTAPCGVKTYATLPAVKIVLLSIRLEFLYFSFPEVLSFNPNTKYSELYNVHGFLTDTAVSDWLGWLTMHVVPPSGDREAFLHNALWEMILIDHVVFIKLGCDWET